MKKIIDLKELIIILVSIILIAVSTSVFATDGLVINGNNATSLTEGEYINAQTVEPTNTTNNTANNTENNTQNNTTNKAKTYNTNNSEDDLPQTGIEDYNIGILLIICVASAIFAYKKINDYKNI